MNISRLRAMILVAEHGSITAASKELFITPTSLLQQINDLENEVGFKIFLRSHRGVKLTKPGELFYEKAKKGLSQLEALIATCRTMEESAQKKITLGVYWPFNLNPIANAYFKLHPEITCQYFSVDYSKDASIASQFISSDADILQYSYFPQLITNEFNFLPFAHDRYYAVCVETHPIVRQPYVTLKELCKYDLSMSLDVTVPSLIQKKLESMGKNLNMEEYTNLSILNKCNAGHLFIMDGECAKSMHQFKAIPIEPEEPFIHGIVYKRNAPAHVMDFVRFVRQQVGEENVAKMEALLGIP